MWVFIWEFNLKISFFKEKSIVRLKVYFCEPLFVNIKCIKNMYGQAGTILLCQIHNRGGPAAVMEFCSRSPVSLPVHPYQTIQELLGYISNKGHLHWTQTALPPYCMSHHHLWIIGNCSGIWVLSLLDST